MNNWVVVRDDNYVAEERNIKTYDEFMGQIFLLLYFLCLVTEDVEAWSSGQRSQSGSSFIFLRSYIFQMIKSGYIYIYIYMCVCVCVCVCVRVR